MLCFDDYRVDPKGLHIYRGVTRIDAPPQAIEVLAYLVENRHRTVSRAELIDRFWPRAGTGADGALNTCIRRIRVLLEDDADTPRYVQTRPRSGYRFIGVIGAERATIKARALVNAAFACLVIAILGSGWVAVGSGVAEARPRSVAIESARGICEYTLFPRFNEGLRESLLAEASPLLPEGIQIIDPRRASDFRLRTSVRQTPSMTTVTLTLVEVRQGVVLWSREFAEPTNRDDYVPTQRRLAARMARSASQALAAAARS